MFNIAQIRRYTLAMHRRGFEISAVLDGTGIDQRDLTNPKALINSQQYQLVVANMLALHGSTTLGMELGEEIDYADLGVLGYAMMSSATLRRAVSLWLNYSQSLCGAFIDCGLEETATGFILRPTVLLPLGPAYRFCLEEFLIFSRQIGVKFSGRKILYKRLELSYPKPEHARHYEQTFRCPIRYGAQDNVVEIASPSLDTPIQSNNAELNNMYMEFCAKMAGESVDRSALETNIYNHFIKSPTNLPNIGELAKRFNVTERTLRRRLGEQGTSYRGLVNQFRGEMAKEYLSTTRLSVKEIAFQLGFTDTSHFLKAFKAYAGMTPKQFRDHH